MILYSESHSVENVAVSTTCLSTIHAISKVPLDLMSISELSLSKLTAFMEELNELNVLRSIDDTRYLFTRFTFFQMMGTSSEVEDKLVEYMEG